MNHLKNINLSGFPLQIGLAHAINASKEKHGWKVLYKEHGWLNERTKESGFMDLGLENGPGTIILNIECKRPQESTWQFLLPRGADQMTTSCKYWASYVSAHEHKHFGWLDLAANPVSYQSEFCIVAGQDSKARPMLERVAATVVDSTEALALEELSAFRARDWLGLRVYVNVIVTTAKLEVCKFDPSKVDLETGTIPEGEIESTPYIRFRKQLSQVSAVNTSVDWTAGYQYISKAKENTVFVIESTALVDFLIQFELDKRIGHEVS